MAHFSLNHRKLLALTVLTVLLASIYSPFLRFGVFADASWLSGWNCRRQLTINGSLITGALTDFPVLVRLDSSSFDFDKAKSNGEDIRFTGADGVTQLKYEIEKWNSAGETAQIWVKIPSVAIGTDTIFFVYYDNPSASDAQDPTNVWDSNFMMVQHLEEPSGTVTDSTSNHNDGNYSRTTSGVEGKIDGAYMFDGVNDYVFVPHSTSLNFGTGPFTISAWVKYSNNPSSDYDILRKGCTTNTPPSPSNYKMEVLGNTLSANLHQDGVGDVTVTSAGSYGDDNWHFMVVEREAQTMRLYVDNNLIDSAGNAGLDLINGANMSIGSKDTLNDDFYAGLIDEVEISNTNRGLSWISASYYSMNNALITCGLEELSWADLDCMYRVRLTFKNSAATENLTGFPVLVILTPSIIDYGKTSATDIRFYDGTALLEKETELWNTSGNSYIWVKVPQIDNSDTDYIYAYYGATSTTNLDDAASVWSGYAMVQHLKETSGTLTDSTSNHNDGSPSGVTQDYQGKIDGGDYYNGASYSVINNAASLNFGSNSFSYSFWFNTTKTAATQDILDKKGGTAAATTAGYKMTISSASGTGFSAAIADGTNYKRLDSGTDPAWNGNVWTMFNVVVNRTSQLMLMYINGVYKTNTSISTVGSVTNTQNLRLGNDTTGLARGYFGGLDEVRVYSSARSSSWVYAEYLTMTNQYVVFGSEESSPAAAPPTYSGMSYSVTMAGEECEFSITWNDPDGLATCVFSTNNTGTWVDTPVTVSGIESLARHTITLNSEPGVKIGYRWRCTDALGNTGDTGIQTLVTTSDQWSYSMKLTFDNSGVSENLIGFPVLVNLTRAGSSFWNHVNSNVDDLKFLDSSATTELYYEVEYWNYALNQGLVWVKVPQVDAGSDSDFIWVCYGNPSPPANAFNSPANVWSGYAMVQHLEETSGTVLTDSTSNHNDGTTSGVTLNAEGQIDGGDNYDGSTSYSMINDAASINFGTNSFSYMYWFKSGANTTQDIIDKKGGTADATNAGYKLTVSSVEATGFSAALGDGTNNARLNTGPDSTRGGNIWAMFTVVIDRAQQKMLAYINGIAKANLSIGTIGSVSNTKQLYIGKDVTGLGRNYNGGLDEVRIYNGSHSANWIHAEYLSMSDQYVTFGAEQAPPTPNYPPSKPSDPDPSDNAIEVPTSTTLSVAVTDPEGDPMDVSFYQVMPQQGISNFTVVVLPDTQIYSSSYPAIFNNQTQWIVDNADNMNVVFVTHEGDIVNTETNSIEWQRANSSMSILDTENVPFGFAPGNHDLNSGVGANYNTYFPYSRFEGEGWYGGAYNNDNTNSYSLFSEGNNEFLIFHFENGVTTAILEWANTTIDNYPNRRVIVTIHDYMSNTGTRSTEGNLVWNSFVSHHADQIFLVLCGHTTREYVRTDTVNGHPVYQLLADYQGDSNGGNGWLRLIEFHPAEDKIYVKTYSPYLNSFETDSDSQFTLDYDMSYTAALGPQLIGVAYSVLSGTRATITWIGLNYSTTYYWCTVAKDSQEVSATSDTWNFTTTAEASFAEIFVEPTLIQKDQNDIDTTFIVEVDIRDIEDLQGFDFNLTWDKTLLTLTNVDYSDWLNNIWGSGNWEAIKNEIGTGYYKLVAVSTARSYSGGGSTTVVALTFTVQDPHSNHLSQTSIHFDTHKLSDSNYTAIMHTVSDGTYQITGSEPTLQLNPTGKTCSKIGETINVGIVVSDEFDVTGFMFEFYYNTTLLDYSSITYNAWGSGSVIVDEVNGIVSGSTSGSAISGVKTVVTIQFTANYHQIWRDISGWVNDQSGLIYIDSAALNYSTGSDLSYVRGGSQNKINVGSDFVYTFSPIRGDVDNDGDVDIYDLRTVAAFFDQTNATYNLTGDNTIDIFDLVVIASNFGYTYIP